MKTIKYSLNAAGGPTHDILHVILNDDDLAMARDEAKRHIRHLIRAGYARFYVMEYFPEQDVSRHVETLRFRVPFIEIWSDN